MQAPPELPPVPPENRLQQSGLSRTTTMFLFVLALLTMASGVSLLFYSTVARPAQLRAQTTATVQTLLKQNAHSTATANTQATGTAQAYANATATAVAQATAQAQATATALQNIYIQATSKTPTLSAPLTSQNGFNWNLYNTDDGGGCTFTGGALHSSVFTKGYYVPCLALSATYTNFAFQVQMAILKGDAGGVLFRANDATSQYYFLTVESNGSYTLYVSKDRNHNYTIATDSASAFKTGAGQINTLTVIGKGSLIYLYINKQNVGMVSDNTLSTGEIGVFSSDHNNNTDVAFTNASIWTL